MSEETPNVHTRRATREGFEGAKNIVVPGMASRDINVTYNLERLSKADPSNVQEIAASQIQLLNGYYELVLGQARKSFRWALIAAGIGLGFYLTAIGFLLIWQLQSVATISLISGTLIEVISAINFYLYGKTSAQLATFHTRLELTQRFLLANSLCENLEGDFKQRARFGLIETIAQGKFLEADAQINVSNKTLDKKT